MKHRLLHSILLMTVFTLAGCSEEIKLIATNEKNVEKIIISKDHMSLDIYCPTGICTLNLSSNIEATVDVHMHYNDKKSFTKIEGVSVNGNMDSNAKIVNENTFTISLGANNIQKKILIVDYYR